MKIAFTHNLRLTDSEEEAEFDTAETVDAIAAALAAVGPRGREDRGLRPGVAPGGAARGVRPRPHLQHRRGPARARARGVLPGAVRGARLPVHRLRRVRPDAHARQVADQARPRDARASTPRAGAWSRRRDCRASSTAAPACRSRSSSSRTTRARSRASATRRWRATARRWRRSSRRSLEAYPGGVLVEEYIAGIDVTVGFIEGVGASRRRHPRAGRVRRRSGGALALQHLRLPAEERRPVEGADPLPGRPPARRRGAAQGHLARRSCSSSACATSAGSTSASATTAASTSSRSTRCRRWRRAPACSPPPRTSACPTRSRSPPSSRRRCCAGSSPRPRRCAPARCARSSAPRSASASPTTSSASTQGRRRREAEYDSPETIVAIADAIASLRPHRRPPRGDARPAARARRGRRRPGLQHRRGRRRPQPRGAGARAVRAARHPVHRLRLGDARDRARQGAGKKVFSSTAS